MQNVNADITNRNFCLFTCSETGAVKFFRIVYKIENVRNLYNIYVKRLR